MNHTQTYDTTFQIKSPSGAIVCEIDIQATICFDHHVDAYYLDDVFGFDLEADKDETSELPYYLIEPVREWLEGSQWANVMLHIEEQLALAA